MHLYTLLKESSLSSRWNTEDMDAYQRNNIYIAELGCTCALKKSSRQPKYNLSIGDYDRVEELKARISYIRSAMGLEYQETW